MLKEGKKGWRDGWMDKDFFKGIGDPIVWVDTKFFFR